MKSLLCILSAIALIAAFTVPAMANDGLEVEVEDLNTALDNDGSAVAAQGSTANSTATDNSQDNDTKTITETETETETLTNVGNDYSQDNDTKTITETETETETLTNVGNDYSQDNDNKTITETENETENKTIDSYNNKTENETENKTIDSYNTKTITENDNDTKTINKTDTKTKTLTNVGNDYRHDNTKVEASLSQEACGFVMIGAGACSDDKNGGSGAAVTVVNKNCVDNSGSGFSGVLNTNYNAGSFNNAAANTVIGFTFSGGPAPSTPNAD